MAKEPVRMTPAQARVIEAVARTGRVEEAARALNMSQSAVSRSLASSEALVGEPLFQRGWSGTETTPAGDRALQRSLAAMRSISSAEDDIEAVAGARPQLAPFLRWPHLEAVAAVVRTGSASDAAVLLEVSQPAVSRSLAAIAGYCHQPLFQRRRDGLDATTQAVRLVTLRDQLSSDLTLPADGERTGDSGLIGRLAVGMLPFSGQDLIARAFGKLANRHPELRLLAVPGSHTMLAEALLRGEIDCMVGILRQPPRFSGLREIFLYHERYSLVAHRDHRCHARSASINNLKDERWIVAPHGTPIRTYFEDLFRSEGETPPAQTCEILSFANAEQVIANSDAIGLLSYSERDLANLSHGLAKVNLELPDAEVAIGLTLRKEAALADVLMEFENELTDQLAHPGTARR